MNSKPLSQVILLSGLSGAGKTVALRALEDLGFYCLDNLPAPLLPDAIKLLNEEGYPRRVAIVIDSRDAQHLALLPTYQQSLLAHSDDVRILFLSAQDDTLVHRFSETRRSHPLSRGKLTISECLKLERKILSPILELAHCIDTSKLCPNQLRDWIRDFVALGHPRLTLIFESFGFKYGLVSDADFVFDARCLPNPHYDPTLRSLTGKDRPVAHFLSQQPKTREYLKSIQDFLETWLLEFDRDNRNYVTVAIGCTGGQHRSVYLVEQLGAHFGFLRPVLIRHREA